MRQGHFASCQVEIGGCLCEVKRGFLVLGATAVILVVEIAGGIYSGSLALLSDAGHLLGDFTAIITAIAVSYLAYRHFSWEGKARACGVFIHGTLLLLVALWVLIEAHKRLYSAAEIGTGLMFAVALFGVGGNLIQYRIVRAGVKTVTRTGMLKHIAADFIQSLAVIVTAPLIWFTGSQAVDLIVSILIAGWMIKGGVELLLLGRESAHHH